MGAVKMLRVRLLLPFLKESRVPKPPCIRVQGEPLNTGKTGPGRKYILESTVTVLNGVKAKVSANVS